MHVIQEIRSTCLNREPASNLYHQGDRGQPHVSSYCELWQLPANKAIVILCVHVHNIIMNIINDGANLNQKLTKRTPRGHSLQGVYTRKTYLYMWQSQVEIKKFGVKKWGEGIYLKSAYFRELRYLTPPSVPPC